MERDLFRNESGYAHSIRLCPMFIRSLQFPQDVFSLTELLSQSVLPASLNHYHIAGYNGLYEKLPLHLLPRLVPCSSSSVEGLALRR